MSLLGYIWIEVNEVGVMVVKFVDEIDVMVNLFVLIE